MNFDVTPSVTADSPPDWSNPATALACPLCEYNLHGLTEPRCPECGFAFLWAELIDGKKHKHPYLFEHQNKRNLWSFWETYSNDSQPRRFWAEVSPAQPVKVFRLIVYWALSNIIMLLAMAGTLIWPLWQLRSRYGYFNSGFRYYTPSSGAGFSLPYPLNQIIDSMATPELLLRAATIAAWPWMSLAALYVFRVSMARAKINMAHVLRAVIYGCDFGLTMALLQAYLFQNTGRHVDEGWNCVVIAFACGVVGTYRLSFAYSRYLRFHLPFLTVLASQVIVFLVVFVVLLQYTKVF